MSALSPDQVEALQDLKDLQTGGDEKRGALPWLARRGAELGSSALGNLGDILTMIPRLKNENEKYQAIKRLEKFGFEPEDQIYKNELAKYDEKKFFGDKIATGNVRNFIDKVTGGYTKANPDESLIPKFTHIAGGLIGGGAAVKGAKWGVKGAKALAGRMGRGASVAASEAAANVTLSGSKALVTGAEKGAESVSTFRKVARELNPFSTQLTKAAGLAKTAGLAGVGAVSSEITDRMTRNPTARALVPLIPMTLFAMTMPKNYVDKGLDSMYDQAETSFSRTKTVSPQKQVETFQNVKQQLSRIKTPESAPFRKIAAPAEAALKKYDSLMAKKAKLETKIEGYTRQLSNLRGAKKPNTEAIKKVQENLKETLLRQKKEGLTDQAIKDATYVSEHDLFLESKDANKVAETVYTKEGLRGGSATKAKAYVSEARSALKKTLMEEVTKRDPAFAESYKQLDKAFNLHNDLPKFNKKANEMMGKLKKKLGGTKGIGIISPVTQLFGYLGKGVISPVTAMFNTIRSMTKLAQSPILRNQTLKFFKAIRAENTGAAVSAATGISKEMKKIQKKQGRFTPVGKLSSDYFERQK